MAQAQSPNFGAILDKAPAEVERPKPLPVGTYKTVLVGLPRQDKSSKKQTEFVEFTHKFIEAFDDVDAEELTNYLTSPDGKKRKLSEVTMKNTFYLTENSLWRLKDFLGHLGFDAEDSETSMRQMIEDTAGKEVNVSVKHRPSQDGKSVFAEIADTAAAE